MFGSRVGDDASSITVAVDANGADLGPAEVAAGAMLAAREGVRVLLFGPRQELEAAGDTRVSESPGIEVIDAPLSIAKAADPVRAVRANPDASIVAAARAVAEGRAQALVSGGSTGAAVAAGLFNVKRATGIYRPALALPLPVPNHPVTLLDVGANVEVRPEHLVQFAFMGAAFVHAVLGVEHPRVGLLSNGEEVVRGSPLVLEAHAVLSERGAGSDVLEFVGNVEGDGVISGAADVVVTDGFTGNVALKLIESVSQMMLMAVREVAYSSRRSRAGGALLRPGLQRFRLEIDPEEQGGAYLLGLRRLGVVPHGRFTRHGFARAILRAALGASEDVVERTHGALAAAGALRRSPAAGPDAGGEAARRERGTVSGERGTMSGERGPVSGSPASVRS